MKEKMKLTYECSPNLLRFFVKEAELKQEELARKLNVTPAAISKAIDQEAGLESLRRKIIDIIKSKQLKVT